MLEYLSGEIMEDMLTGVSVLELGKGVAVGYAGKLLADMGADVIKIEPPEGDTTRKIGPFPDGIYNPRASGTFAYLHAGKRNFALDSSSATDTDKIKQLLAGARIILCGTDDAAQDSLDEAQAIHSQYPLATVVNVSALGAVPGYQDRPVDELTLQALGGISLGIGSKGRPPLRLPGSQTAYQGGICAAIAAAGSLFSRTGAFIDLASIDVWATLYNGGEIANDFFGRKKQPRAGYRVSRQPYLRTIFKCADGYFAIQCTETRHWAGFLAMTQREDLSNHPLFANRLKANDEHAEECDAFFATWFEERKKETILDLCLSHKIPGAPVYDIGEVLGHPHLRERRYFVEAEIGGRPVDLPSYPFKSSRNAPQLRKELPRLESNDAVWKEPVSRPLFSSADNDVHSPLQGITVVDFGWVWAGAIPGQILADLGATVIRVEGRKPLDFMRQGRPIVGTEKDPEQNPVFQNVNRGKLSVCLDLAQPEAARIARELVARSDVVIENFSPGVMDRFGLSWQSLQSLQPALVMCSMSAAGQTGPLRNIRTYAAMIASLAGMNSLVGYPGERVLGIQAPPYADPNAGLHAAFAILAALAGHNSGKGGRHIDFSQWEAAVNLMGPQIIDYAMNGRRPGTCGTDGGTGAPYGHYPVRGTDRWIAIAVTGDEQWNALQRALGAPAWMRQEIFESQEKRRAHAAELDSLLSAATSGRDGDELAHALRCAGVPSEVLLDVGELLAHPYFQQRNLMQMVEHPTLKEVPVYRLPWRTNGKQTPITRRAPRLGEHTSDVLQSMLGKSESEIADLRARNIIN